VELTDCTVFIKYAEQLSLKSLVIISSISVLVVTHYIV